MSMLVYIDSMLFYAIVNVVIANNGKIQQDMLLFSQLNQSMDNINLYYFVSVVTSHSRTAVANSFSKQLPKIILTLLQIL